MTTRVAVASSSIVRVSLSRRVVGDVVVVVETTTQRAKHG